MNASRKTRHRATSGIGPGNHRVGDRRDPRLVRAGFTLVEMLIVVLLLGILIALAAPSFRSSRNEYRARLAAWRVATDLQTVSALALAQGRSVQIHFRTDGQPGGDRYWVAGVEHPTLRSSLIDVSLDDEPYQVKLSGAPATIAYDMYGMPDGDYDLLVSRSDGSSWQVLIRHNTSRVEVLNGR